MASTADNAPSRSWLVRLLISTAIAFIVIVFVQDAIYQFDFFDRIRLSFIDRSFKHRGPLPIAKDSLGIVIVTITEKSDASLPEHFPFPRSYYARAIRNLNRAGAKAIGIDLTFEQPDTHGSENDDELYRTIQQYRNVVVAGKTDIRSENATVKREDEDFHSIFYTADSAVGSVFVPNDADGIFRRYMPFTKMPGEERYIPTFAFALLNKALHISPTTYAQNTGDYFVVGNRRIPKFDDVSMLINYCGPAGVTFKQYDIANILDDSTFTTNEEQDYGIPINIFDDPDMGILHDGSIKNKIVLIGPYFSESKDLFNTPVSQEGLENRNQMYGVEIHANALQTLLDQNYLIRMPEWQRALCALFFSLLTFFVVTWLKLWKTQYSWIVEIAAAGFVAGLIYGVLQLSYYSFSHFNLVVPVVTPVAAVILNYGGSAVYQYLTERKQKTMIKGMFSQYLNPSVVNELIANPEKLRLGGEKKELTVFFSDIASFTDFSEKLDAVDLVHVLNEYLTEMTDIILKNDGTLDKYVGDAVMAIWGAPVGLPNTALSASRAALQMQAKVQDMARKWESEGKNPLVVRMGLNTDFMVVGNVGGAARFDYTVIGDAVNLGSRLEGANKTYGTRIMISERTYELIKNELLCRELDHLVVKGKTKPIRVFELIADRADGIGEQKEKLLSLYNEGIAFYKNRQFKDAEEKFFAALAVDDNDGPSQLYLLRSQEYVKNPPPKDWNGVFVLKTK